MARYVPRDRFYQQARAAGFRSRAVFKLEDLLRKAGGLRRGQTVVELGCWPGGWLQLLAQEVGPEGFVLGVDTRAVDPLPGVTTLELDFTEPDAGAALRAALGSRMPRAILCDAAPSLTGIRDVDRAACEELYEAALRLSLELLGKGGFLIAKGFPGPGAEAFRRDLRAAFVRVSQAKPEASRKTSQEFYWLAAERRPG